MRKRLEKEVRVRKKERGGRKSLTKFYFFIFSFELALIKYVLLSKKRCRLGVKILFI